MCDVRNAEPRHENILAADAITYASYPQGPKARFLLMLVIY
jgi:hypothetical protein